MGGSTEVQEDGIHGRNGCAGSSTPPTPVMTLNLSGIASPPSTPTDAAVESHDCGCCWLYPKKLQWLAKPQAYLICICALVFTQSMVVSGYTKGIVTTIERRYDLWSSETGLILSSYDVTSLVAVIVVSYIGEHYNRAKWLGRGSLIIAVGTMIYTLPYFFGNEYKAHGYYNETELDINLCNSSRNWAIQEKLEECENRHPERWALGIFIVAQMVIGIGASPVYTLGPTYLYDNVKSNLYAVYAGESQCFKASVFNFSRFLRGCDVTLFEVHL